jgi:chromosome segregation ATPase
VIEQIMIFASGCLVSGLLALLVLPLFWRRALRLARRRVEMQMPLSLTEIVADRDRLRAEFAVEKCQLQQSIESQSEKRAEALARMGRAEAETLALKARAVESERSAAAAHFHSRELETQLGALAKELHDADELLVARSQALALLQRDHRTLAESADERRALNAPLETRLSGLEMRFADALRDLAAARTAQARAVEQARASATEAEGMRKQVSGLEARGNEAAARGALQERRVADLTGALAQTREELAEARNAAEELRRALGLAEERVKALRSSLERQSESRRSLDGELAGRLEATEVQIAGLKAALEDARRDNANLRRAGSRRRAAPREGRSLKGLEVVTSESSEERQEASPARAEDSLLDRPA